MPGLDVDLDLGPLEVMAGVRAGLSELNAHNKRWEAFKQRETARARTPVDARLITVGSAPAGGGRFALSVGGPDPGYYWLLQRLVIGGLTFKTVAAGSAELYVSALTFPFGSSSGGYAVSSLGLSDLVDQTPSLPNISFYSPHQVIVQEQENLAAIIDSATAAQQYVMAAQFQVFRTISANEEFTA